MKPLVPQQPYCLQDEDGLKQFRDYLEKEEKKEKRPGDRTKYIDLYTECKGYKAKELIDTYNKYLSVSSLSFQSILYECTPSATYS